MTFMAYDKVPYFQHANYIKYAELTPGRDAERTAYEIFGMADSDDIVKVLAREVAAWKWKTYSDNETYFFVVLNANCDAYDLYFLEEDSVFHSFLTGVAEADIVLAAKGMVQAYYARYNK